MKHIVSAAFDKRQYLSQRVSRNYLNGIRRCFIRGDGDLVEEVHEVPVGAPSP